MTLNNIKFGDNNMCVPSVISAITGISTDEAAARIAALRGTSPESVRAVWPKEAEKVLNQLGYACHYVRPLGSLYMTCMYLSTRGNNIYYIGVPHHAVCIEVNDNKVYFLDNHTKQPMNAAASARLMQKVNHIWKIVRMEGNREE